MPIFIPILANIARIGAQRAAVAAAPHVAAGASIAGRAIAKGGKKALDWFKKKLSKKKKDRDCPTGKCDKKKKKKKKSATSTLAGHLERNLEQDARLGNVCAARVRFEADEGVMNFSMNLENGDRSTLPKLIWGIIPSMLLITGIAPGVFSDQSLPRYAVGC